ncbi:hypothetical protein GCM10017786_53490 [Amycolatopsis deserti]|uniref:Secreted protein n=1 Tax=Amycolatopsis deserti TaxID=185696 RepID=A0ABQ3JAQ9_9PSEU|nr:hypothetical protein [Amycolatopsis deserti]GHF12796.1 hypothetical protein GCM10017786_53490 [Amycolatopsis deserti]
MIPALTLATTLLVTPVATLSLNWHDCATPQAARRLQCAIEIRAGRRVDELVSSFTARFATARIGWARRRPASACRGFREDLGQARVSS